MSYNSKYKGAEVDAALDLANTALQEHQDISGLATKDELASKVDKVDGKQLSTEDFTTTLKEKLDGLSNYDDTTISEAVEKLRTDFDTLVSGDTTTAIKTFNEIIAFLDGIEDSESLDSIIASIEQQIAAKGTVTSITAGDGLTGGTITGSGTIALEDLSVSGDFPVMSPSNRIANSTSDTNLTYGTITEGAFTYYIDKYGRIYGKYWEEQQISTVKFEEATTSKKGLMSATDKTKLDGIDMTTKQDTLVSGTNIKTINGISILGSGNIVIEGGSSSGGTSSGSAAYPLVEHGTSDTTFTLTPNTFHVWDEVASLDLSFGDETSGVANEFLFQFTSGATATTLTLPDDIKWANDSAPTIAENMIYQISVLRGLASLLEFSNEAELIENRLTYDEGSFSTGATITFQYPVASDVTINLQYHGTGSITIPVGETTATVDWSEPSAPIIIGISPVSDNTYIYMF